MSQSEMESSYKNLACFDIRRCLVKSRGRADHLSMATDKIAALRATVLFGSLTNEELRALASRCMERKLSREEILFIAGEEARGLYVVVSGAVRAFRAGADGREQVIHTERAGAILADVPVFDDGTYPATAVADEDSVVLFIAKGDVRAVCLEHPTISLAALKTDGRTFAAARRTGRSAIVAGSRAANSAFAAHRSRKSR